MLTPRFLETGNVVLDDAYRLALADLQGNVMPFRDGILEHRVPCVMAGLHYGKPWTRDTSINAWNGAGLLVPEAMRNTLLSVLTRDGHGLRIGGQYWDAIIWATGAWAFHLHTGDREFLALALEAVRNSLTFFEQTEFDPARGLFRGGACFADGIAAYPDRYLNPGWQSGIEEWSELHPDRRHPVGEGMPAMTLSSNCLYYQAYVTAGQMATELGQALDPSWSDKARSLRDAINRHFWDAARGTYAYLLDDEGLDVRQEGLGVAFAVLFGIADPARRAAVLANVQTTPHGIACLWPQYERYAITPDSFGRHCGVVWPHVNAFWADAVAECGRRDMAYAELAGLAKRAVRDMQFAEIYHPLTGAVYGGLQENPGHRKLTLWASRPRQTWCATGYLRMVLATFFGCRFTPAGLEFRPWLPEGIEHMRLRELTYRKAELDIEIERAAEAETCVLVDGKPAQSPHVPASAAGIVQVHIRLGPS